MGVPYFYSWLVKRYPLIKEELTKKNIPEIGSNIVTFRLLLYGSQWNYLSLCSR